MTKYSCQKTASQKKLVSETSANAITELKGRFINLGLESLVARGDGALLVIAHNVSAAFACTSGGFWIGTNISRSDNHMLINWKRQVIKC